MLGCSPLFGLQGSPRATLALSLSLKLLLYCLFKPLSQRLLTRDSGDTRFVNDFRVDPDAGGAACVLLFHGALTVTHVYMSVKTASFVRNVTVVLECWHSRCVLRFPVAAARKMPPGEAGTFKNPEMRRMSASSPPASEVLSLCVQASHDAL